MLNYIAIVIGLSFSFIFGALLVYYFFIKTSDLFETEFKNNFSLFEKKLSNSNDNFTNQLANISAIFENNINSILQNVVVISNQMLKVHKSLNEFNRILEQQKEFENEIIKLKSIIRRLEKKAREDDPK